MTAPVALITGVSGQDGWHLAEFLLARGYRVAGTTRSLAGARELTNPAVELSEWDLRDEAVITDLIRRVRPSEVYNLAAYASGAGMFDDPVGIGEVNGLAVSRMLEAIRAADPSIRFCQASSSELFGEPATSPQSETTAFHPRSPYGAAKLYAHEMVGIYRRRHGLFACSAILFNHESPRRGEAFVTGKVSAAAARIKLGLARELVLGNLDVRRDWGFSGDYMRGGWQMLQAGAADDYVLATGEAHSVRELCECAFEHVGLDYRDYVREDLGSFRASEPNVLAGDASKARRELGWSPSITFPELVRMMVDADLTRLSGAASGLG
jgi:GDPmannose 4,6-dehydratase